MKTLVNSIFLSLFGDMNYESLNYEKPKLISDLIDTDTNGSPINFYPGKPSKGCFEQAVFVSLSKQPKSVHLKNDQFYSLDQMLHIMFEHIFLKCLGMTEKLLFLCDQIDTDVFARYRHQFEALNTLGIEWEVWYLKSRGPEMVNKLIL